MFGKPLAALAAATAAFGTAGAVDAKVLNFQIIQSGPAFDGQEFGETGAYERIDAVAEFAIDPASERGKRITDLAKAPVGADGLVHFSTEVTILRPADPAKASGVLFYDVPNRGRNLAFMLMNLSDSSNIPSTAAEAGDGYLMREGYTIVWSGWQADLPDDQLKITLPVLPDVTGLSREEMVFDKDEPTGKIKLTYPAADLDPAKAVLSIRREAEEPRSTAPGLTFTYLSPTEIEVTRPQGYDGGAIYEFIYPAKDAVPAGLGFAATSDLISYLRGNPGHDAEPALAGINHTIALGISQSGRFLRDLIYSGFNSDEQGARVFDGAMPHIAGSRKTFTNMRFAQPGRYSRQHEDHDFPGDQFPFTYAETSDPISNQTGSIMTACEADQTCPKVMHSDTSTEFWQARAALISTGPDGKPLIMPDNVRLYFLAGQQHFTGWNSVSSVTDMCRYPSNPVSSAPIMRALLARMKAWLVDGTPPPDSRYPSVADGSLVPLYDLALPNFGTEPYVPVYNELQLRDHSSIPPAEGAVYPVLVPQLDEDGNPTGGIDDPAIAESLGTSWGWNIRNQGFAAGDLCGLTGSLIPFDQSERDSRKPLAERYTDEGAYLGALSSAADALIADGYMLAEDKAIIAGRGKEMWAARPQ